MKLKIIFSILICAFTIFYYMEKIYIIRKNTSFPHCNSDVFISLKTTKMFHQSRLNVILNTWFQLAKHNTFIFTDFEDNIFANNEHVIVTACNSKHNRDGLTCKMQAEFNRFLEEKNKIWFCHFDDDQYVNVIVLYETLLLLDVQKDWYIGKASTNTAVKLKNNSTFWFATGGAGFCINRQLVKKMKIENNKFIYLSKKLGLTDDILVGYIIEWLLKVPMTHLDLFHSHLENLTKIKNISSQISLSYSLYDKNVVNINGLNEKDDPTRFYSIHNYLYLNEKSRHYSKIKKCM